MKEPMKSRHMPITAILISIILGFLSTHAFSLGYYNLVLWGVVGAGLGFFCSNKKTAIWVGTVYGFCLSVSFLLSGFQGAANKFLAFALFSLGLSMIGAVGGLTTSYIGCWIKKKHLKPS